LFATSVEATTTRAGEAVGQAKEAYEHIVSSPPAYDGVNVAVDAIPSVNDALTKAASWEPLLEKIRLCTEIMDKIAEV
jgi:hypothetical protein